MLTDGDDGCELFGQLLEGEDLECRSASEPCAERQDELANAEVLPLIQAQASPISGARCINGNIARSVNAEEEPPSTARRQSTVHAPGGVCLGRARRGFGKSPGIIPGRQIPPPPPPSHPLQRQFRMLQQHLRQPRLRGHGYR